jgi:hypothetical protein
MAGLEAHPTTPELKNELSDCPDHCQGGGIGAIKNPENFLRVFIERMAATYSRGSYTTTTIGHAAFDCRVRDGNGSDHCGNATKLCCTLLTCKIIKKIKAETIRQFFENYTQESLGLLQFAS